ncbi:MAG TPA: PRC-barrel domain-containing protein [Capillimicrobium sp.]|jgi:hypothetical protein
MTGPDIDTALEWRGRTVRDPEGEKIGSFGDVYLDRQTDRPAWGGVRTGLFGTGESLVPLDRVTETEGGDLAVPYPRDLVKDAPRVDPDVALDADEESRLYAHYEQDYAPVDDTVADDDSSARSGEGVAAAADADADEGATMIRSEEEVVAAQGPMRPAERVRLKKVLVTDEVTKTVPVRREVVQLEHEPAPEGTIESVEDVDER